MRRLYLLLISWVFFCGCAEVPERPVFTIPVQDSVQTATRDTLMPDDTAAFGINTGRTTPDEVVAFAMTLEGIPYSYACASPDVGFDCSGFITYVFDHFNIDVPRSSVDFTNVGKEVDVVEAKPGDIILFRGTNSSIRTVGHMGIVVFNVADSLSFIHSTSGSANSVTITPLNESYKDRFVKVIRIFPQNERRG